MKLLLTSASIFIILSLISLSLQADVNLNNSNYKEEVLDSHEAWLIEYYSEMCGSCKQFSPIWDSTVKNIKKLKIGRVNIDDKLGMELAKQMGVLNEGIPCVRLVHGKNGEQVTVMAGDITNQNIFVNALKAKVAKHLSKSEEMYRREDL